MSPHPAITRVSALLAWPALVALAVPPPPFTRHPIAPRAMPVRPALVRREIAQCTTSTVAGRCLPRARCPAGRLDLDGACLAVALDAQPVRAMPSLAVNGHVDRHGRWIVYEHLPRRADVPTDYDLFEFPLPSERTVHVGSGYDLQLPDAQQRRGAELMAVGHGGIDLPAERATPVYEMPLRDAVGRGEVVYAGWLFGNTVIVRQRVREHGATRSYVVLHGHLDGIAPGVARGVAVPDGTVLGYAGDTGAEGFVHLHYEVRLLRPGVDPDRLVLPEGLMAQEATVPCDPRNVLPLRAGDPRSMAAVAHGH